MFPTNRSLLATASLAALLTAGVTQADAQTRVNGGGATLPYPTYLAEFTDLFSLNSTFIFANAKASTPVSYYGAVGSGKGTAGFLNNDYTQLNGGAVGTYKNGTTVVSVPAPVFASGTTVHYGASDGILTSAQVSAYNTSPGLGTTNGPLIQLPAFGVPVTVAFTDGSATAVTLNDDDVCGIFSGKLTNWNQTSASASVPAGPITVGFRGDTSGTTFLFSNHLASVCTTGASGNSNVTFVGANNFSANFASLPANFVPGTGNGGVQANYLAIRAASSGNPVVINSSYVNSAGATVPVTRTITNSSQVAYLGPDYTSIAPNAGNYNANVRVASLRNRNNGTAYLPNVANTTTALSTSAAPPSTAATAANPTLWVPVTPNPAAGYPIVGFTNLIVSQCYKSATVTNGIKALLQNQYNNNGSFATDIANSGFVKVPNVVSANYVTRINGTFLANTYGYNLDIGNKTRCKTGGTTGTYAGR